MLLGCALLQTLVCKKCISSLKSCYKAKRDGTKKLPFLCFYRKGITNYSIVTLHISKACLSDATGSLIGMNSCPK